MGEGRARQRGERPGEDAQQRRDRLVLLLSVERPIHATELGSLLAGMVPLRRQRTVLVSVDFLVRTPVGLPFSFLVKAILGSTGRRGRRRGHVDLAQRRERGHGWQILIHPGLRTGQLGPHSTALLLDVTLEQDDVLAQLVACAFKPDQLSLEGALSLCDRAAGLFASLSNDGLRLGLSLREGLVRLLLRFLLGDVGCAVGERECATQRAVIVWNIGESPFGPHRALGRLPQPVMEDLDTGGRPLKELIDVVSVVSQRLLRKLHLSKRASGDLRFHEETILITAFGQGADDLPPQRSLRIRGLSSRLWVPVIRSSSRGVLMVSPTSRSRSDDSCPGIR